MITPKQQALLNRLQQNPITNSLLTKLNLTPIPSPEYQNSIRVNARVSELISTFKKPSNSPAVT